MERASPGSGPGDISPFMDEIRNMFKQLSTRLNGVEAVLGNLPSAAPSPTTPNNAVELGANGTLLMDIGNLSMDNGPIGSNGPNGSNGLSNGMDQVIGSKGAGVYVTPKHVRINSNDVTRESLFLPSALMEGRTDRTKRRGTESSSSDDSHSISGSESDSSDTSLEESRKASRRKSLIVEYNSRPDTRASEVLVHRNQPSYAHIRLKVLTVKATFEFINEIVRYQQMHKIGLAAATMVDNGVMAEVMAKCPKIATNKRFFSLSNTKLLKYLRQAIRPKNKLDFAAILAKSVEFSEGDSFKIYLNHFEKFYSKLLTYRKHFTDVYEFLAHNNKVTHIPRCDNKEGGLIQIFNSKIPDSYGAKVLQVLAKTKFDSIYEYLDAFFVVAKEHNAHAENLKKLNHFLPKAMPSKTPPLVSRQSGHRSTTLNHIADDEMEDDRKLTVDEQELVDAGLDLDELEERDQPEVPERAPDYRSSTFRDTENEETFNDDLLHAMQLPVVPRKQDKSSKSMGCYRKLWKGNCDLGDRCQFSHDPKIIDDLAQECEEILRKRKERTNRGPSAGFSFPKRDPPSRPPPKPPYKESKLFLLNSFEFCDTIKGEFLNNLLMYLVPESIVQRAVFKDGFINVGNNTALKLCCLFDTGALSASYIN